jgi:hypothetical protein
MAIIKIFEEFWRNNNDDDDDFSSELNNRAEEILSDDWKSVSGFFKRFNYFISLFDRGAGSSYSNLCRVSNRRDPDYTSEYVQQEIDEKLIQAQIEWKEIVSHKKEIFKCLELYDSLCGLVDVILWRLDTKYNVGGWSREWVKSDEGKIDSVIKYQYGYHNTSYGSIYIQNMYSDVKNFFSDVGNSILKYFLVKTNCVNNIDSVLAEMQQDPCVKEIDTGVFTIYFEDFYYIISPYLRGVGVHDTSIETIGKFFINYLNSIGINDSNIDIDKDWSYIEIQLEED